MFAISHLHHSHKDSHQKITEIINGKVLTWAQHSSSKGFDLDPNLRRRLRSWGRSGHIAK